MNRLLLRRPKQRDRNNYSDIQVYHNIQFPLDDILDVLYPLFSPYYPYDEFINMIYTVNHIFCAYNVRQRQCVGCALVNDKDGGLYVMLFGVRQSSQGHGTGTQLLQAIIRWARRSGYPYIQLDVHVENYKAIGLYEKVGFRKSKFEPFYYAFTSKRPPHAYRMILQF